MIGDSAVGKVSSIQAGNLPVIFTDILSRHLAAFNFMTHGIKSESPTLTPFLPSPHVAHNVWTVVIYAHSFHRRRLR